MNYYELLGVPQNADQSAIKAAFRKKAKKYHPDTNPGNVQAEKIFKELNEAYSVLSDETKRAKYDREQAAGSSFGDAQAFNGKKNHSDRKTASAKQSNPFMGFQGGFNFDEMMGAGMKFEKRANEKTKKPAPGAPDFMNTSAQFAQFFGFKPR